MKTGLTKFMPLIFKIYISIFILLTVSNLGYWIYIRGKLWLVLYDFTAGMCLVLFMIAYFKPVVEQNINIFHVLFFLFIVGFEFYMTTFGDPEKFGIKMPEEFSNEDTERARMISLLFSAPAYVVGGMLSYSILLAKLSA